jgi:hypothetical protein
MDSFRLILVGMGLMGLLLVGSCVVMTNRALDATERAIDEADNNTAEIIEGLEAAGEQEREREREEALFGKSDPVEDYPSDLPQE